jgi:two-component system torCAD operon response regulator TorR
MSNSELMAKPCVLIVDDERDILELLHIGLSSEGFDIHGVTNVADFMARYGELKPDLCMVDVTLPDGNGFSLVKQLRQTDDIGIVILTGRGSETDHVLGLELGADDYITKPFRIREVAARLNAVLRRSARQPQAEQQTDTETSADFEFDGYRLVLDTRTLYGRDGQEIELTTAEFNLLVAFLTHRKPVLSRDQSLNIVKGRDWESYDRAVDGLVSRLRRKLPVEAGRSHYIKTIHGIGYAFHG